MGFFDFLKPKDEKLCGVLRPCGPELIKECCRHFWPGLEESDFKLGDFKFRLLDHRASDWLWSEVPRRLPHPYTFRLNDCENKVRRRLAQMDDVVLTRTDLDLALTVFEIRGFRSENGNGHSMILEVMGSRDAQLREYGTLTPKKPSFLKDPWLIYS